jgi:hypothetical protein
VAVTRGSIMLAPDTPTLQPVTINAGQEVEITRASESAVAPIGKAGAPPGSVDREKARELVIAAASAGSTRCGAQATGITLTRLARGWTVALRFTGNVSGSTIWTITGTRVAAANLAARKIATGCPGSHPSKPKPGQYNGQTTDGKTISFDVSPDSTSTTNLSAAGIVTCTDSTK